MSKKLASRLATYQENVYPAMMEVLAEDLGVSVDSLTQLGVGYIPIAHFKNGPNFSGWWCSPERDEMGRLVGLALRSRIDDTKVMSPGSKRGLAYPYSGGSSGSRTNIYGWIRLRDAKVDCPLCGKPDGCLVSRDNPHDPSKVICIRISEGAVRETGLGWEHVLRPSVVNSQAVLPPSDFPVVIVEGLSDTAAALDMGFVAVGRPSALGGMATLAKLVRGRPVIIVGENDDGVGKRGLNSALATLRRVCPQVRGISPPENVKDLRDWCRIGLDRDAFLKYVEEHGQTEEADDILLDNSPLHIAERWLLDRHTENRTLLLRRYKGQWFLFYDNKYNEIEPDAVLRGGLYTYLDGRQYKNMASDGSTEIQIYDPTRAKITDIVDALNKSCPILFDPPCWLDERAEPNPRQLIYFTNGYLNIDDFVQGDVELLEPTANLFTLAALPYAFDLDANCPLWMEWLTQTLGDDPEKILLLQEWFGYCMTPDMTYERFMLFRGRSGSGKSTALEVLRALVGPKQSAFPSFATLCNPFGRACLVGKLAAIMSDARLPRRADAMVALETLLAIVGQDSITVNRKNLPEIPDYKPMCRFTIAVNELPQLPDYSQALERRLLALVFRECFKGRENFDLKKSLPREAPGIANWALHGLIRLREQGGFTEPESSRATAEEFRRVTSPVVEFVEEACILGGDRESKRLEIYDAWIEWCRERGLQPGPRSRFQQRIVASFPDVIDETKIINGHKVSRYVGIDLESWARKQFLKKP